MKYLIAVTLPRALSSQLAKIQRRHKSERWNIALPPHITLLPPAKLKSSEKELTGILAKIASQFSPFEIRIFGVGKFRNHGNTIFAKVRENQQLSSLQKRLSQGVKCYLKIEENQKKFRPHITLSNQLSPDEAREKFQSIRISVPKQSFLCREISLLKKEGDNSCYKKIADFALGEK